MRNGIELARSSARAPDHEAGARELEGHLTDASDAVDRLRDLARLMRAWRREAR